MKNEINISELTQRLHTEDRKYGTLSKRFFAIYLVLVGLYIIVCVGDILNGATGRDILSSGTFLVAMSIFVLIFFRYNKEYNNADYSQPTLVMLKSGVKRYKLFRIEMLWILIGAMLIGFSLCLKENFMSDILLVQVIYWVLIALAVFAGVLRWRSRYKPLHDDLIQMIRELTDDNSAF